MICFFSINQTLEHPPQMWDMCQMLNIWHISHIKPNLSPFSRCGIWCIFCNIEQYCDKFATVRNACDTIFILCLFLFLSHLSVGLTSLTPILSSLSHPNPHCSSTPTPTPTPTSTITSTPTPTPISL